MKCKLLFRELKLTNPHILSQTWPLYGSAHTLYIVARVVLLQAFTLCLHSSLACRANPRLSTRFSQLSPYELSRIFLFALVLWTAAGPFLGETHFRPCGFKFRPFIFTRTSTSAEVQSSGLASLCSVYRRMKEVLFVLVNVLTGCENDGVIICDYTA